MAAMTGIKPALPHLVAPCLRQPLSHQSELENEAEDENVQCNNKATCLNACNTLPTTLRVPHK